MSGSAPRWPILDGAAARRGRAASVCASAPDHAIHGGVFRAVEWR